MVILWLEALYYIIFSRSKKCVISIVGAQLVVDVFYVGVYRVIADVMVVGDKLVGHTHVETSQDLFFPAAEAYTRGTVAVGAQFAHYQPRYGRTEGRPSVVDVGNRFEQFPWGALFEDVAGCSGPNGIDDTFAVTAGGVHHEVEVQVLVAGCCGTVVEGAVKGVAAVEEDIDRCVGHEEEGAVD